MPPAPARSELIARKWLNLALRRLDYYNELYRSGRWKHYYSEEAMVLRMRDVMKAVHLWGELVRKRGDDKDDLRPAA
jgi:uncharacterized repeat protein (TIGR03809 family)